MLDNMTTFLMCVKQNNFVETTIRAAIRVVKEMLLFK